MLDSLRKPFLWAALILLVLAFLAELGMSQLLEMLIDEDTVEAPGWGIPFLAFLDGLLLFVVLSTVLATITPERIQGRLQSLVTLILSILVIIGGIAAILAAMAMLIMMVALFMAAPFGTAVYLAKYGTFATGSAGITLAVLMMLKLGFAICLVLAHQRFLLNKSLVILTLCSFLTGIIVSFLHSFVPGILVSITDMVGAIVVAIIAVIWAVLFLISSIPGVVKSIV